MQDIYAIDDLKDNAPARAVLKDTDADDEFSSASKARRKDNAPTGAVLKDQGPSGAVIKDPGADDENSLSFSSSSKAHL